MAGLNVKSEIKPLKKVLLHRPGRDLQKRDVVEQQLFERVRRQVQKLFSRAVQQDFLQGLDLALDVHS